MSLTRPLIKRIHSLPLLILIISIISIIMSGSLITHASENKESIPRVYDNAGLLSTDEIEHLENLCIEQGDGVGIEILVLTHNDSSAEHPEFYLEDFNDTLPEADRVLLLVDMYNRIFWIQGYGSAETYIHSDRIDQIVKTITSPLSKGNYVEAFETYITMSRDYMEDDSELNRDYDYTVNQPQSNNPDGPFYDDTWPYDNYGDRKADIFTTWWVQLIISFIIGGIAVGVMAYNSGGKMTAGSSTYLDRSQSGLIGRRDQYLRTRTTRVRRPKQNNSNTRGGGFNSGGFRGGVSSGGRSHSSGGGRF
ncbi:MAG TPA: hypothetical protein GXZ21_07510 [Clostridiales bacterium]|nr:hypothetical protein [Clostridiales bacterium]